MRNKRGPRVIGAATLLVLGGLMATVLPAAAADVQAVLGKVIGTHGTLMVAASNSMTVYTFTKDVAGDGKSACTGGCLTNWPALTIPAGSTPTGDATVTGALGTIVRADNGLTQVTYAGKPLYFFAKDVAVGDTNGIYPNWEAVVLAAAAIPSPSPTVAPTTAPTRAPTAAPTLPPTSTASPIVASDDGATMALVLLAGLAAAAGTLLLMSRRRSSE